VKHPRGESARSWDNGRLVKADGGAGTEYL
jgi:hypothetical protein